VNTPIRWQDPEVITAVVTGARSVAVIGASPNPARPSHGVAAYLLRAGLRVYPVNPALTELFGLPAYRRLADVPEPVDVVDVFRRPEFTPDIAAEAVAAGAKALWLQLGVVNEEAARTAAAGGLAVVQDQCLAVEHRRLMSNQPTVP
jgi:predicted CoA-binding protein